MEHTDVYVPMGALRMLSCLVCMGLGGCTKPTFDEPTNISELKNLRFFSPGFAIQTVENRSESIKYACLFGSDGEIMMRLPLQGRSAAAGKLGGFEVITNEWGAAVRTLWIYDDQGRFESSFDINGEFGPGLGRESIVLSTRRGESGLSSRYDLQFLSHDGTLRHQHVDPDRSLVWLQHCDNDHWIAHAVIRKRHHASFVLYDPRGKFLWEYEIDPSLPTTAALSHSGRHAAVVVPDEWELDASVHLLDANGAKTVEFPMPSYSHIEFTPNERYLLILGHGGMELRDVTDGNLTASINEDIRFASVNPVRFAPDGATLWTAVITHDLNGDPHELQLRQWELQTFKELLRTTVPTAMTNPTCPIIDIQPTKGFVKLIMPSGIQMVPIEQ